MATGRTRNVTKPYIIFVVVLFLLMIFPFYGLANRVFPLVLGLPFGLFWVVLLEVIAFVALCCFYRYEYGNGGRS
ncbi:hypothetical protein [Salinisphaera aquimarina]|uniref:DUF3311 domain-containing protein n=1 Tax=Salinisphaera aquimarina TaxID=2094031 RepID=A0ABV7EIK7_9GAMM